MSVGPRTGRPDVPHIAPAIRLLSLCACNKVLGRPGHWHSSSDRNTPFAYLSTLLTTRILGAHLPRVIGKQRSEA
jgi:hypothetical protein